MERMDTKIAKLHCNTSKPETHTECHHRMKFGMDEEQSSRVEKIFVSSNIWDGLKGLIRIKEGRQSREMSEWGAQGVRKWHVLG